MDCCINDLGKFPHNEPINLGITAPQDGEFIFYMISPTGGRFNLKYNFLTGEDLIIPIETLNESMAYKFKIEQPDGVLMTKDTCENFQLTTIINTQQNGCNDTCDADPASYYGS